jgi:general stress protein 26
MKYMLDGNLEFFKTKIEYIRYAVMKVQGKSFLNANRFMIESHQADDNGFLWCSTKDRLPKQLLRQPDFPVCIKYVLKEENMFMKITGRASLVNRNPGEEETLEPETGRLLRIKISEAVYFKKKTLSQYTSVLQAVWKFSFKNLIPKRKAKAEV